MLNQTLQWHTPHRYYIAVIKRDLLGDTVVHRMWGALYSRRGGQKVDVFGTDEEAAQRHLEKLSRVRSKRGYVLKKVEH